MNMKLLSAAIAPTVLCVLAAAWGWQQQQSAAQAVERARKAEGALTRMNEVQDNSCWERLEQDAALLASDLKEADRTEAGKRFREGLRRLKSRYGYPQLHAGGEH
jgi:hypothetical protein